MTRYVPLLLLVVACGDDPVDPTDGSSSDGPVTTGDTGSAITDDSGTSGACSPPDEDPAPTRDGHPTDGWRWTSLGTMFPDRAGLGPTDGDLSPTLVDTGDGLHLLYNRQDGNGWSLWASTSTDGLSWTDPVPVTGLGDDVAYPSLVYRDGTFHLFHGSGSVAYATSTDGVSFTPVDTVFRTPDAGDFASLSMLYPHAMVDDAGAVELWYAGFDGQRYAIGRASAPSAGEVVTGGSVYLERDPKGWDNTSVAMPMVVDHEGVRHIWYGGYDTVIANPGPWRVGRLDTVTGERLISLPLGEAGVDAYSTRDPAVVPWGAGWLMVYVGMGDDSVYRLLSATSDVCP